MKEEEIRQYFSGNLMFLRKTNGLTQLQLSKKLNYSDKSISKWEKGNTLPDVIVLKSIADYFEIKIDDLISRDLTIVKKVDKRRNKMITLLSVGVVWLVATIVFVALKIFVPSFMYGWLAFIYALPVSGIVFMVFACMWFARVWQALSASLILWGLALSIFLSAIVPNIWLIFIIACVIEVLIILWFAFKMHIDFSKIFATKKVN